jgi:hypothetical protein
MIKTQFMRGKILFLMTILLSFLTSAHASHIVGGEIEMKHVAGNEYRITLNLYFDAVNGLEGAIDEINFVNVFRKNDNFFMGYAHLPKISDTPITYTDPRCAVGSLRTRHIVYEQIFTLPAADFSDPQGYYLSWERCCRNSIIENINNPSSAAQVFYMEFPPVTQNNLAFINSTPSFPTPNNPYACLNQPFTLNWGMTDPDGDQLVYSLRTPTNGNATPFSPVVYGQPAPYTPVQWLAGYAVNNMIQGNPALQISQNGLLTMTPSQTGLFVFAVVCEERRNGIKIGETVREFQIMVLDCNRGTAPQTKLKLIDSEEFYDTSDVMVIDVNATNKCTKLQITDVDDNTVITARIKGTNFNADGILKQFSGNIVNGQTDKLLLDVCFDQLPASCTPYEIEFEVQDNTCGSPLFNRLKVNVLIQDNTNAIKPVLECISLNEDGTKTATFGYENFNTQSVRIPVGEKNKIIGANFLGQTTDFQVGRWYNAFQLNYSGAQVPTWEITVGACQKNINDNPVTVCSTPCSTDKQRFLVKNLANRAGLVLESPERIEIDFQTGAYIEINADGSAYLFGDVSVKSSETMLVPVGSLWRLRLHLDKSDKPFCANKGNLGDLITDELIKNWNYLEINTLKSSLTALNGLGYISLAQKFGNSGNDFNAQNCYGFQLGKDANGKNEGIGASSSLFFSINYRDEKAEGSLNVDLESICLPLPIDCQDFAIRVIEYNEEKTKDGSPIDSEERRRRNNPARALGAPQENDTYNFVSLGFGGSIVLELGSPVYDHNKFGINATNPNTPTDKKISFADLIVVETSFGYSTGTCGVNQNENYPERARFYGTESLDKAWVLLAEDCRTTFVDVAPAIRAGHQYVKYLKIVDVSNTEYFIGSAEGYDVDGVIICPEAVRLAIEGGQGRMALLDARNEPINRFDGQFFNRAPNSVMSYTVHVYPNPVAEKVFLNFISPEENEMQISVFDGIGKIIKNLNVSFSEGKNEIEINLAGYTKGLHLISINTESGSLNHTFKIVKD